MAPVSSLFRAPSPKGLFDIQSLPLLLLKLRAYVALIFLIAIFSALSKSFLSLHNLIIVAEQVSVFAVLGVGESFVILAAGIDLSVGAITGLSAMTAGALLSHGLDIPFLHIAVFFNVWLVCAISVAIAALVGVINGLFVTRLTVTPFIQTLGMLYIARGSAELISNGKTYSDLAGQSQLGNVGFLAIGDGQFIGVPYVIWVMVIVAAIGVYITRRTVFGRQVFAVGGNADAAGLSGVAVNRVRVTTYAISGFCAGLAGLMIAARLGASNPSIGESYELNAIAVTVLGGTSLFGGIGTIGGTIIGAFVLGVLSNGMILLGIPDFWQTAITGGVIIFAVVVDQLQRRAEVAAAQRSAEESTSESGEDPVADADSAGQ